jgi:hypothetical protein
MTPKERAAMRSLIAEVTLNRQEIRRLKARQAVLEQDVRKAEQKRAQAVDQTTYLHGVLVAKGIAV